MGGLVATQGHGDAWAWAAAAGPMFGFMALMKPCFLLMFMAPDSTKGREDKAVESWCGT